MAFFDFIFRFIVLVCCLKICHGNGEQSQETKNLYTRKASILSTKLAEAGAQDRKRKDTGRIRRDIFHISSSLDQSSLLSGSSKNLASPLVAMHTYTIPHPSPTKELTSNNILLVPSQLPSSPPASQSTFPLSTAMQTKYIGTLTLQRLRSVPEISPTVASQAPTMSPAASYPASKLSSPISATPTNKLLAQAPKESSRLLLSLLTLSAKLNPSPSSLTSAFSSFMISSSTSKIKPKPLTYPKCRPYLSCKGRCLRRDNYLCKCDPECEILEDCCADFDLYCNSTKYTVSKDTRRLWKCQRFKLQESDFWMIQACPKSWPDNDIAQKCINNSDTKLTIENYADVVPVTSNTNMDIYRNRFCAQCNSVKKKDIRPYGLDFSCSLVPPQGFPKKETLKFLFKYCSQITWKPNVGQSVRRCYSISAWDSCYVPPLDKKCTENPSRIVAVGNGLNYKNIYCAMCQMRNLDHVSCGPLLFVNTEPEPNFPSSFAVIMDISRNDPGKSSKKVKVNCKKDEVYDVYLEVCRSVASKLSSTPVSSHFDRYRIAVWVTLSSPSKQKITTFNSSVIVNIFSQTFGLKETQVQFKEWQEVPKLFEVDILFLDVQKDNDSSRRKRDLSNDIDISAIIHFTRPLKLRWKKEFFTIIKATAKRLTCINIKHYSAQQYLVLPNSNDIYIKETSQILNEKEYYANQTEKQNGTKIPTGDISVCTQQVLDCVNGSYITLQRNEFTMLSNQSVYRNVSDSVYKQDHYYKTRNGSVVVCSHFSNQYTRLDDGGERTVHDKILVVLTYVGLSLSVTCLAATLITYTLFAELRTLPGINLMNLSSALLAAHLFWLIGSGLVASHRACVAMAVILHFAFLASFMWMSIIAFSTWRAFSNSGGRIGASNDKAYRRKRIMRTLAVGWLPVLVFVGICISLDQSQAVSIQYGGSKGCWINNGTANLCVFVIPVVIAMIWNAAFFGLTVRSIQKVRQQARMATEQRENQNSYFVYIKIAVLMGFTWIFGVLGSLVSAYLMYPFVVLCTLQGVYIAFSFTFTRRVLTLYRSKFARTKINQTEPSPFCTSRDRVKMDTRL